MARIAGIDIPNEKRIEIALTYVKGIGPATAKKVLAETGIDENTRAKDLTEDQVAKLQASVNSLNKPIEGELRRVVSTNIRRLQETGSYRGLRHRQGLPVRGQRTSHNARTRKGKRKTVGGMKKKLAKK